MSQSIKPTSSPKSEPKIQQPADKAVAEAELEKVSGGVTTSEIHFTKLYDKASPKVG
jgi:type VI protein secretion system component Hcp